MNHVKRKKYSYGLSGADFGSFKGAFGDCNYTVQDGDSLSAIAQDFYGDSTQYMTIANANGISDPNSISVGQVLTIPSPTDQSSCDGGAAAPAPAVAAPTASSITSIFSSTPATDYTSSNLFTTSTTTPAATTAAPAAADTSCTGPTPSILCNTSATSADATSQAIPFSTLSYLTTPIAAATATSGTAATTAAPATTATGGSLLSILGNLFAKPAVAATPAAATPAQVAAAKAAAAANGTSSTFLWVAGGLAVVGLVIGIAKRMNANNDDDDDSE